MATMRSPNYPAVGLSEAVELCRKIWDREKRSFAPPSVVVQAFGYSGLSGASRIKLAALKRYDLLEENENGDVRLSDTAMQIIHHSDGSPEQIAGLRHAGLSPDLFRELHQTYPVASVDTLRSYLLTRKGFSDIGANACIEAFRDTQKVAKLEAVEAESSSMSQTLEVIQSPVAMRPTSYQPAPATDTAEMTFRWHLSRGVIAELKIIGDAKPAHLALLKQYLDVAKSAMEIESLEG